jgi:hypothetical protein
MVSPKQVSAFGAMSTFVIAYDVEGLPADFPPKVLTYFI